MSDINDENELIQEQVATTPRMSFSDRVKRVWDDIFNTAHYDKNIDGVGYQFGDTMSDTETFSPSVSMEDEFRNSEIGLSLPSREQVDASDVDNVILNRRQRYISFDNLEDLVPEAKVAVDIYAEESVSFDADGHCFKIICGNNAIKEELEFLFFSPKMLNFDRELYPRCRKLCKYGDDFWELVTDPLNPQFGILKTVELDPSNMWRIQTRRGKLLEFQQTRGEPNYDLVRDDIRNHYNKNQRPEEALFWSSRTNSTTNFQGRTTSIIRFAPAQIIHLRLGGGEKRQYLGYGTSVLDGARRAAFHLRILEDSLLLYRLIRAPERRVYYVDLGQAPANKADSYLKEFRNSVKRKKIVDERTGQISEKYNALNVDDDMFIPVRPGSGTRVETLPGAAHLNELEDLIHFHKKFFMSMGVPPSYMEQTVESQSTRFMLSALNIRFATRIYRIQRELADAIREVASRHLTLLGVPETLWEDLKIIMTPPSEVREMAQAEVMNNRANLALSMKNLNIVDDDWIRMNILRLSEDENTEQRNRIANQQLAQAELEAQKLLIQARVEVEVERGKAIAASRLKTELAAATGPEEIVPTPIETQTTEPIPEQPALPTEDELAAVAPGPEDIFGAQTEPSMEPTPPSRRLRPSAADIEIEREGI